MLSARRQFLDAFLGAFGATEILDYTEAGDHVTGTIRFSSDSEQLDLSGGDEDDFQDFRWDVAEDQAPAPLVYHLVEAIHRYHLLSVDKLRVSRDTLLTVMREDTGVEIPREELDAALDALKQIQVLMLTDGVEDGDSYFIRE